MVGVTMKYNSEGFDADDARHHADLPAISLKARPLFDMRFQIGNMSL